MNFSQLETAIRETISDYIDQFSIYIKTNDGIININAYEPRKAASTIKIPILLEGFRQIQMNQLQPDKLVYIEKEMKVGGAGVINYLTESNVYSYRNLLELMIIVSDNTAANLMLDKLSIHSINELAMKLGCAQTIIERKFMDENAKTTGHDNYTSAKDLATFLHYIAEPNDFIDDAYRNQMLTILNHQKNNQKLPYYHNETDNVKIFHKTGELAGVEHDAAIITNRKQTIYASILSERWENNGLGKHYIAKIGRNLIEYMNSGH